MFFEFLQGGMRVGQHTETQHTCFKEKTCSIASGQKDEDAFCLVSFLAHCPSWDGGGRGGVYVRGLPALLYLDLFHEWRSFVLRTCEILQLFLTGFGAFFFVIHHPTTLTSLKCSSLLTCVHLRFPSCQTSRVDVEPGCWGYDLLDFPSNQSSGQGSLWISPVLAGSMEF